MFVFFEIGWNSIIIDLAFNIMRTWKMFMLFTKILWKHFHEYFIGIILPYWNESQGFFSKAKKDVLFIQFDGMGVGKNLRIIKLLTFLIFHIYISVTRAVRSFHLQGLYQLSWLHKFIESLHPFIINSCLMQKFAAPSSYR